MCGFVGFLGFNGLKHGLVRSTGMEMASTIAHRGPDSNGCWVDFEAELLLCHRRLSVVDLSENGNQPMVSGSGRFVIVFNGEIYNHLDIRKQLEDAKAQTEWRSSTDTETLLAAIDQWGVNETLLLTVGMFSFVLWDRRDRCLYMARDRIGEKPLYYGLFKGVLMFGSELKALKKHPAFSNEIDTSIIHEYLRHGFVPTPFSIFKGVRKLSAGTYIKISSLKGALTHFDQIHEIKYWSLDNVIKNGLENPFVGSLPEAVENLKEILNASVRQQLISDVPLGAFLSGGIDSSIVVAMMQAQSASMVKTFTIGFDESSFDEAGYAKKIAKYLGTEHRELYVSPRCAQSIIPELPLVFDEPFADPSQIPTFLISQLARESVTVALSGDGGDEIFGGYHRYQLASRVHGIVRHMPDLARMALSDIFRLIPLEAWNVLRTVLGGDGHWAKQNIGDKAHKLAAIIEPDSDIGFYRKFLQNWNSPNSILVESLKSEVCLKQSNYSEKGMSFYEFMMADDTASYLPDDVLVKLDRTAMRNSLETRAPLLDHRLIEFAWQLPLSVKIKKGSGKYVLKQVLYDYLPKNFFERPKMGFGLPIASWLRGPLQSWASHLLDHRELERQGIFRPNVIREVWSEHLSGKRNWHRQLWNILMFQAWLKANGF